ncbi:MAG: acetyl-CoA carboxylase biotin carboxyl carrier protein subunit [Cyclobacteriaceae bacterium]|nr:acetyl-CoA carboxylase biotin carboxyl carrier protein subunit [Cyclobacteriaceae bacterium]
MLQATVNNKSFNIQADEDTIVINGEELKWDIEQVQDGYFHILYHQKSYRAEVVSNDPTTKTFTWKINGRLYTVNVKDKFDLLLEKMGIGHGTGNKVNSIKAPMPGLIIDLKVKEGDSVQLGEPLLILEAMKMENILKSPREGLIKSIKIKKGDSVEKGFVLIEF